VGRIEVNVGTRTLTIYKDGKKLKTYRIAVGTSEYPTPTGTYRIVNKQTNPTWNPPDSPWAKGLGPIPPGPGNPLGTRWIGTSAPAIGIHGTYADYSIGTAASHGCLRMHMPDVEELFEKVNVGMPVVIST
jgi:lipoprotein-anchoring transpeptidase ErfK/SrfK